MKKITLSLLFSVFVSLIANADTIDAQQALRIARATLTDCAENGARKAAMAKAEMRIVLQDNTLAEPAWYVVTPVSGEGFVIVAGDDSEDEVIGYSTEGTADAESMPPALRFLLDEYANHIALVRQGLVAPTAKDEQEEASLPSKIPSSVTHLVKAEWHQGGPYNNLCPIINGSTCLVGCTALAMAQVMHYYKYPISGTGTVKSMSSGSQISELKLDDIVFDYDNMLNIYTEGGYTEEQANEVATLCLACGYATNMQYTPSFSGAYIEDQCKALINRFKYSSTARIIVRTGALTNDTRWKKRLKEELAEGRPIFISGYHATNGGHSFICDGYSSLKFHINWGWGPGNTGITYNGNYNILTLVPNGESGGYTDNLQFLVGVKPAAEGEDTFTQYFIAANDSITDYTADGNKLSFTIPALTNATAQKMNGSLYGLVSDVYGNTLQESNLVSLTINGKRDCDAQSVGMEVSSDLQDGSYYLRFAYKPNNSQCYQKIESWYNKMTLRLTVANGNVSAVKALTDDETATELASGIKDVFNNTSNNNTPIYNIQGQQVSNPQKGIYIKNGKKILVQ